MYMGTACTAINVLGNPRATPAGRSGASDPQPEPTVS